MKSCEVQHKFNSKVRAKLVDATHSLMSDPDTTRNKIEEGMSMLDYRNKLVKLADSSESGWKTVDEYIANPIASDSDDEKKMDRAISRANKKVKAAKTKSTRGRNRYRPYRRENTETRNPMTISPARERQGYFPRSVNKPGTCFGCGKAGHWRQECPGVHGGVSNPSAHKISRSLFTMHVRTSVINENKQVRDDKCCPVHKGNGTETERSPVGRLKGSIQYWEKKGTSEAVLSIIESGYKLPFREIPPSVVLSNNKTARDNPDFVKAEIEKLLRLGCVTEVPLCPAVVNPLTVAFNKTGKPRLVLDCRHINPYLHKFKFKYDDAKVAREVLQTGDYLFTFDLKSAYHHIEIFSEHRKFLGFQYEIEGRTRQYIWNVLAFGVSTAAFQFSKVLREVVKSVRSAGHRLIMYLDDGIGGHETEGGANEVSRYVKQALTDYGFLLAEEKCHWKASRCATWLGYTWSMEVGVVRVTTDRIDRLLYWLSNTMTQVTQRGQVLFSVRYVAALVGRIISMQGVVGSVARLRTRALYTCVLSRASWNARVMLTAEAIDEIEFWLLNVQSMNDKGSTLLNEHAVCDVVVCTDASAVGYGGYVQEVHGEYKHEGDLDQIIDIGYGEFVYTRDGVPLDEHGVVIGVHVDSGDATVVVISPRDGVEAYDAVYGTQGVVRPAGGQGHGDPGEGRPLRGHVITDNTPGVCRLMKGGAKAGPSIGRPLRGQCGSTHSADRSLGGHIIPKTGRPLKRQA
ncbi:uncharacterized protein LOC110442586 [Mizuhopecten yessoensis]|uniref:uncharacterized protein LOC110442586 n=1 Tax=Mizuhopecten yessoensis TaxID=6573 RepID=UPI000B45F0D1|nr:uncharacterized protein LOC110442586 [Mizuhopecten yessoensis]